VVVILASRVKTEKHNLGLQTNFSNKSVSKVFYNKVKQQRCCFNYKIHLLHYSTCYSVACLMNTQMKPSQASEKSLEAMKNFSETYAKRTGTYFCSDLSVTAVVIEGLAKHKDELGAPLCPCRHYEDKEAEAAAAYWNCPCVPMRERKECHCMLFLTTDNPFVGDQQEISIDEIRAVTNQA
jgi:ferredoxin-thioredoxin reductase catalytic chain